MILIPLWAELKNNCLKGTPAMDLFKNKTIKKNKKQERSETATPCKGQGRGILKLVFYDDFITIRQHHPVTT